MKFIELHGRGSAVVMPGHPQQSSMIEAGIAVICHVANCVDVRHEITLHQQYWVRLHKRAALFVGYM